MKHRRFAAAAIAALVGVAAFGGALPAWAASEPATLSNETTEIQVHGEGTWSHFFSAYLLAKYSDVEVDWTSTTPVVTSFRLTTQGTRDFLEMIAEEISLIEWGDTSRVTCTPASACETWYVENQDPMEWVATTWQGPVSKAFNAVTADPTPSPTPSDYPSPSEYTDAWGNKPATTSGKLRELANWLQSLELSDYGLGPGKPTTDWTWNGDQDAGDDLTFSDLVQGLYVIQHDMTETMSPPDARDLCPALWDEESSTCDWPATYPATHSPALMVGTKFLVEGAEEPLNLLGQTLGVIEVKGDPVVVDKTVDGTGKDDATTKGVGDTVSFTISATVPNYDVVDTYPAGTELVFSISDQWSSGLSEPVDTPPSSGDVPTSVSVTANGTELLEGEFKYLPGGDTFTISLTDAAVRKYMGQEIVVSYDATILEPAELDPEGIRETNTAWVNFTTSSESSSGEEGPHPPGTSNVDETTVYSFPLEITKMDLVNPGPLAGACFEATAEGSGKTYGKFCSGTDGKILFKGLPGDETYLVTESDAPPGYVRTNLEKTSFNVKIETDYTEESVTTVTYTFSDLDDTFVNADGTYKVTVYNAQQQSDMPFTGGNILTFVGIAGALAVGAAGLTVVGLKKRGREQSAA